VISNLPVLHSMNLSLSHRCITFRRGWRAARSITALALIIFFVATSSVQAGPIVINQVSQTVNTYQGTTDLRISALGQTQGILIAKGPAPADGPRNDTKSTAQGSGTTSLDALLSFPFVSDPQKLGADYVEEAEVEGSVCDCGDIPPLVGGFPKWPLLFLAAVPLVFINHDCEDCNNVETPTPTPTPPPPTPPPTPVPEPASLLLLGTGLLAVGAGLRRRHGRTKLNGEAATTREED
jgi:PEP-CTERM motif-containing protein